MKTFTCKSIFLLVLISIATFSCKKDKKEESKPAVTTITCKINGTSYTTNSYFLNNLIGTFYCSFPFDNFTIAVNVPNQVGSNNLASNGLYFGYISINNQTYNTNVGGSGNLTITKLDTKTTEGTFYFTAKSTTNNTTITVSDGKFYLLK